MLGFVGDGSAEDMIVDVGVVDMSFNL